MSISDEVKRLHELHQAGALTDAEFEAAKARLFAGGSGGDGGNGANGGTGPSLNKSGLSDDPRTDLNQLRRSRTDRWLGGVCGGLAKVTGLESWILRLLFVLVTMLGGAGVLIYILMWIFVPEEN
jgi:phage shock protein PspC (stress-responsive transcriptional regulator)